MRQSTSHSALTLSDLVEEQLEALMLRAALGGLVARDLRNAFRMLTLSALDRVARPPFEGLSQINPDGLPFQWCFCLNGAAPSVRFLCEMGPPHSRCGNRLRASLEILEELLCVLRVPRPDWLLDSLIPLVLPPANRLPQDWRSAVWFAVGASRRGVLVKLYLNLEKDEPVERWKRIGRALLTLDRRRSLERLCELSARVSRDSWPVGICCDVLASGRPGRLKAYFHAGEVLPSWLDAWYSAAGFAHELPLLAEALDAFAWHPGRPYWTKSLFVSTEFDDRDELCLKTDLAVSRWVATDAYVHDGVRRLAAAMKLDDTPYLTALRDIGDWPVSSEGTRTHHVVGIGSETDGGRHLNIYCQPPLKRCAPGDADGPIPAALPAP